MRSLVSLSGLVTAASLTVAAPLFAQQPPAAPLPRELRLTVDDAVRLALDRNVDLAAARLDPGIGDTRVAAAAAAFRPTFTTSVQRNAQADPPSSFLVPVATQTDAVTSDVGVSQTLPRLGTSYRVSWTAAHTSSNSVLNSYDPIVESGVVFNVSQPLLRDLPFDSARHQLATARIDREVADSRLREALVHTTAAVKRAYWNLVSAIGDVDARQSALALAQELVRVNTAKVNVGSAPPLDLVAARAEVAADEEQLIIAQAAVKRLEDDLRALILDTSDPAAWSVGIDPVEAPPVGRSTPDLDGAVAKALGARTDLAELHKDIDRARLDLKFTGNQRLPDVRVNATYVASGLGGTQVLRTGGFPGSIVGPGAGVGFGSVLNQLITGRYSTWSVGLSVSRPIGASVEEANHARSRLQQARATQELKSAKSRAIQQVRDAWRQIETNARRIETARAARELADQRVDAERRRFDAGLSTSFLVIQAQRDLTQAKSSELAATLAYALALVDFDAVQQVSQEQ